VKKFLKKQRISLLFAIEGGLQKQLPVCTIYFRAFKSLARLISVKVMQPPKTWKLILQTLPNPELTLTKGIEYCQRLC